MSSKSKKPADKFDKNELFEYFSELASDEHFDSGIGLKSDTKETFHNDDNSNLINSVIVDHVSETLHKKISREEIRKVIKNMKNNKAAGIDKIIPELLKGVDDQMLDVIELLLNLIFEKGVFPEEWTLGVITILFKDGETNDLNNYRGITLLSMLGKILVGVLNNRLIDLINKERILDENQGGFREGYRTTDHLFTLHALINHYIKVEKKELFLCFVDFRKAFDKVSHCILWMKLFKYGISGKFMTLVKSMYEQVKSCVKSRSGLTYYFKYKRGVRQGCLLSPVLFSLFLNDLQGYLLEGGANGITLWDIKIFSLLYADDLVLIAESEEDLKLQMRILGSYADDFEMEINPKKTKVMIFNDKSKTLKTQSLVS